MSEGSGRAVQSNDVSAKSYQVSSVPHTKGGEGVPRRGDSAEARGGGCEPERAGRSEWQTKSWGRPQNLHHEGLP